MSINFVINPVCLPVPQICKGLNASTVGFIGIKPTLKLRSWCISPDGKLVIVGYDEGVVQVGWCNIAN